MICWRVYTPVALADIPVQYQMDKSNRAIPVDFGDVCINYDKAYFLDHKSGNSTIPGGSAKTGI